MNFLSAIAKTATGFRENDSDYKKLMSEMQISIVIWQVRVVQCTIFVSDVAVQHRRAEILLEISMILVWQLEFSKRNC